MDEKQFNVDELCIEEYTEEAQPYIRKTLADPGSLCSSDLQKVAEELAFKACLKTGYYKVVALACQKICNMEYESELNDIIPSYNFRNGLITALRNLFADNIKMRSLGLHHWMCFVRLVALLYIKLRPTNRGLTALSDILFECLNKLAKKPCIDDIAEVDLLCCIFHDYGSELNKHYPGKLNDVTSLIRDAVLEPDTDPYTRHSLMELLELKAHGWTLSQKVAEYYYGKS